jgi:hypothetical protein
MLISQAHVGVWIKMNVHFPIELEKKLRGKIARYDRPHP